MCLVDAEIIVIGGKFTLYLNLLSLVIFPFRKCNEEKELYLKKQSSLARGWYWVSSTVSFRIPHITIGWLFYWPSASHQLPDDVQVWEVEVLVNPGQDFFSAGSFFLHVVDREPDLVQDPFLHSWKPKLVLPKASSYQSSRIRFNLHFSSVHHWKSLFSHPLSFVVVKG